MVNVGGGVFVPRVGQTYVGAYLEYKADQRNQGKFTGYI